MVTALAGVRMSSGPKLLWVMLTGGPAPGGRSPAGHQVGTPGIEYGEGVVCYTQQQAEQLAAHFDEGAGAALSAVNAGEHDRDRQVLLGAGVRVLGLSAG